MIELKEIAWYRKFITPEQRKSGTPAFNDNFAVDALDTIESLHRRLNDVTAKNNELTNKDKRNTREIEYLVKQKTAIYNVDGLAELVRDLQALIEKYSYDDSDDESDDYDE